VSNSLTQIVLELNQVEFAMTALGCKEESLGLRTSKTSNLSLRAWIRSIMDPLHNSEEEKELVKLIDKSTVECYE
jgi:hypothetical protein